MGLIALCISPTFSQDARCGLVVVIFSLAYMVFPLCARCSVCSSPPLYRLHIDSLLFRGYPQRLYFPILDCCDLPVISVTSALLSLNVPPLNLPIPGPPTFIRSRFPRALLLLLPFPSGVRLAFYLVVERTPWNQELATVCPVFLGVVRLDLHVLTRPGDEIR